MRDRANTSPRGESKMLARKESIARLEFLFVEQEEAVHESISREERWAILEKRVEQVLQQGPNKIVLDVGGKRFATSKSTLLCLQDTFFTAMLCSDHWKPCEDGTYFIDRNPEYFGRILDYMRTSKLHTTDLNFEQLECLKEEMDFYQIDFPVVPISFIPSEGFITTNDNKTCIRGGAGSGYAIIRADKELALGGAYEWTIRLDSFDSNSRGMCVGVGDVNTAKYEQMFGITSANQTCPGPRNAPNVSGDWQTGDLILVTYRNSTITILNKRSCKIHKVYVNFTTMMYPFFGVYSQGTTFSLVDCK